MTIRRLKFTEAPTRNLKDLYLRFANEKKVQVPHADSQDTKVINFGTSSHGTAGLTLVLSDSTTKVPIELLAINQQILALDDILLAQN